MYWKDTARVLKWLAFSEQGMWLEEVSEVFTIDLDNEALPFYDSELKMISPEIVKDICSSLVVLTETEYHGGNQTRPRSVQLQLAHFTVKEFLLSNRLRDHTRTSISRFKISEEDSHKTIALCCM